MYYSTGNHEEFRWDLTALKQRFRDCGVKVLDEKTDVVYQRKSRLRKKIASIPCLHQDLFLSLLPK
jgi:hypothetical protein